MPIVAVEPEVGLENLAAPIRAIGSNDDRVAVGKKSERPLNST